LAADVQLLGNLLDDVLLLGGGDRAHVLNLLPGENADHQSLPEPRCIKNLRALVYHYLPAALVLV
jgi:hypothetical protein